MPLDVALSSAAMHIAATLQLRGADAVHVALATSHREPLVTLDTEILERARSVTAVLTPAQWLHAP